MPEAGPDIGGLAARARRSLTVRARAVGVRAGVLEYRAPYLPSIDEWRRQYEAGDWDYLGGLDELPRYSLLSGYIASFGGDAGASILDLGCGAGTVRQQIAHMAFERYLGVDPIPEAVERARRLEDERTAFLVGDAFSPEVGRYDLIIASEVLYMVPDPAAIVDRVRELLEPGGHLISSNFRHPGIKGIDRMLDERLEFVDGAEAVNLRARRRRARRWRVTAHARPGDQDP